MHRYHTRTSLCIYITCAQARAVHALLGGDATTVGETVGQLQETLSQGDQPMAAVQCAVLDAAKATCLLELCSNVDDVIVWFVELIFTNPSLACRWCSLRTDCCIPSAPL